MTTNKPWFSNPTEAVRWIRDEARQFVDDNPAIAAHWFEAATMLEQSEAALAAAQMENGERIQELRERNLEIYELQAELTALRVEAEGMRADAARWKWVRENIDWLIGDSIEGCAYSCQIDLGVIDKAQPEELMDMIADFEIEAQDAARKAGG